MHGEPVIHALVHQRHMILLQTGEDDRIASHALLFLSQQLHAFPMKLPLHHGAVLVIPENAKPACPEAEPREGNRRVRAAASCAELHAGHQLLQPEGIAHIAVLPVPAEVLVTLRYPEKDINCRAAYGYYVEQSASPLPLR